MLIPTKFNGYQAGIRLSPGGGGGGPAAPQTSQEAMGRGPIGDMINKISPGGGGGGSGPIGDMINKISPDTSNTPHLLNAADFLAYRLSLRAIAVNPPTTVVWPTIPSETWG